MRLTTLTMVTALVMMFTGVWLAVSRAVELETIVQPSSPVLWWTPTFLALALPLFAGLALGWTVRGERDTA